MTDAGEEGKLTWNDDLGIGYYPVELNGQYGHDYWSTYVSYRASAIAEPLMRARMDLVADFHGARPLVDIGIGSGHFIETRRSRTFGYDVNPMAIRWLLDRDLWWDPYSRDPEAVSCWDSLEHMGRPEALLRCVRNFVFLSIPIFEDLKHVRRSKHFKPSEHFWYFTRRGLVSWMKSAGFELVMENSMETDLGREDIGTFVFKRAS
jgi:Methyltransferase domain